MNSEQLFFERELGITFFFERELGKNWERITCL